MAGLAWLMQSPSYTPDGVPDVLDVQGVDERVWAEHEMRDEL